jgi:3-methyl-2-oxobutanoate hydroxymethyltransferase
VLQDMLGMNPHFKPKFLKHYADGYGVVNSAVNRFDAEIRHGCFPTAKESYR